MTINPRVAVQLMAEHGDFLRDVIRQLNADDAANLRPAANEFDAMQQHISIIAKRQAYDALLRALTSSASNQKV